MERKENDLEKHDYSSAVVEPWEGIYRTLTFATNLYKYYLKTESECFIIVYRREPEASGYIQ